MKDLINSSIQKHSEALSLVDTDIITSASNIILDAISKNKTIFLKLLT